jgi:hypothetical protein
MPQEDRAADGLIRPIRLIGPIGGSPARKGEACSAYGRDDASLRVV